jgi:copper chaperone CopZ
MSVETVKVNIDKMTCGSCSYKIESELSEMDGVKTAKVDLPGKNGTFTFDSAKVKPEDIVKKINDLGFVAKLVMCG